jgi:hypothetical protein
LLSALALAGCASGEKLATKIFAADKTIVYDRTSDLLPPEGLRVTSNADRQISLAWDPVLVGDVAGYAILERSSGSGGRSARRHRRHHRASGRHHDLALRHGLHRRGRHAGLARRRPDLLYRVHPYDRQGRMCAATPR